MYNQQPYPKGGFNIGQWLLHIYKMRRTMVFGGIIFAAMLSFELFNYSTTDFALTDLIGHVNFFGLRWAMVLSIAFCGIDFAGIARLFTPEKGRNERTEVWYLLAAWFLAATMNAMLTWWGISLQLLQHSSSGTEILDRKFLLSVVPVFVSILVWVIRILLIGMLSMAGERLFSAVETNVNQRSRREEAENRWSSVAPRQPAMPAPSAPRVTAPTQPRYTAELDDEEFDRRPNRPANEPYRRPQAPNTPTYQRPPAPPPSVVRPVPKPTAPTYAPMAAGDRPASRPYTVVGSNHDHGG